MFEAVAANNRECFNWLIRSQNINNCSRDDKGRSILQIALDRKQDSFWKYLARFDRVNFTSLLKNQDNSGKNIHTLVLTNEEEFLNNLSTDSFFAGKFYEASYYVNIKSTSVVSIASPSHAMSTATAAAIPDSTNEVKVRGPQKNVSISMIKKI